MPIIIKRTDLTPEGELNDNIKEIISRSTDRVFFSDDCKPYLTSLAGATFKDNVDLMGCTYLTSIAGATFNGYVDLRGCTGLTSLAGATFKGFVDLVGCTGLTSIAGATFNRSVYLDNCTGLTSIADATFNGNVNLNNCTGLTSLADVTFKGDVSLRGCTYLTSLAGATFNGDVNLFGCTGLIPTPELIAQLEAIEANGHTVSWPAHLGRGGLIEAAKARLNTVITTYESNNSPARADDTSRLFTRFLSEGLGQRDGKAAIVASINPFLEFIEKDPNQLEWINQIAGKYLQGCVNQPVAGFSEISAWVAIAQAQGPKSKLEAARQLMALDVIKNTVAKILNEERKAHNQPHRFAGVEVEAGNAFLREVHTQLVNSGMKPWPGVPGSVAYQGTVSPLLTDENITYATIAAAESNSEPLSQVAKYLIEFHGDIWGKVAFPQAVRMVTRKYAGAIETASGEYLESDPGSKEAEEALATRKDLEYNRDTEIASKVRRLTQVAVHSRPDLHISPYQSHEFKRAAHKLNALNIDFNPERIKQLIDNRAPSGNMEEKSPESKQHQEPETKERPTPGSKNFLYLPPAQSLSARPPKETISHTQRLFYTKNPLANNGKAIDL